MTTHDLREQHKEFAAWYIEHGAAETVEDVAWLAWKAAVLAERAKSEAMRAALVDTLDFLERHSNRWDGVNGKHPFTVVEAARAALRAEPKKEQQP